MTTAETPLAPAAHALYAAYAALGHPDRPDQLLAKLGDMEVYASERDHALVWDQTVRHLRAASTAISAVTEGSRTERSSRHQVAVTRTMSAILAFEKAHRETLAHDCCGPEEHPSPPQNAPRH
ncbi:hypothetical protein ACIOG4_27715 [Streptomyces microflavus]|uniref:hypothetical protein n=1 Tax=Streptomyces microflavus TaxID=1919 RepID=UPI00380E9701